MERKIRIILIAVMLFCVGILTVNFVSEEVKAEQHVDQCPYGTWGFLYGNNNHGPYIFSLDYDGIEYAYEINVPIIYIDEVEYRFHYDLDFVECGWTEFANYWQVDFIYDHDAPDFEVEVLFKFYKEVRHEAESEEDLDESDEKHIEIDIQVTHEDEEYHDFRAPVRMDVMPYARSNIVGSWDSIDTQFDAEDIEFRLDGNNGGWPFDGHNYCVQVASAQRYFKNGPGGYDGHDSSHFLVEQDQDDTYAFTYGLLFNNNEYIGAGQLPNFAPFDYWGYENIVWKDVVIWSDIMAGDDSAHSDGIHIMCWDYKWVFD